MSHYRITPLDKKSIRMTHELFRSNPDESISTLCITEIWGFGQGFIDGDFESNLDYADSDTFYAKPDQGENEGCEFEGLEGVYFEFSDDVSEDEQEHFKHCYFEGDDEGNVIRKVELRSKKEYNELHEKLGGRYFVPRDKALKLQKHDYPVEPTKTEEEVIQIIKDLRLDTNDKD